MMSATRTETSLESVETLLRDELAQGDAMISTATPILRHLLVNDDRALFSDEVVARVRAMTADAARQLLHAEAQAGQIADRASFLAEREDGLVEALVEEPAFLAHVHALSLEGTLALQLQELPPPPQPDRLRKGSGARHGHQPGCFGGMETVSRLRPLARRRFSTARPVGVAIRARNPWVRFRRRFHIMGVWRASW